MPPPTETEILKMRNVMDEVYDALPPGRRAPVLNLLCEYWDNLEPALFDARARAERGHLNGM